MLNPEQFFKCLADATRLRFMVLLCDRDAVCVCDLAAALEISQPKASRHLAQLRSCGLVEDERRGQWVYYRVNPALDEWQRETLRQLVSTAVDDPRFKGDRERLTQSPCAVNG